MSKTKKPKPKEQKRLKVNKPKVYQTLNAEVKYKKEKLTVTIDAGLTDSVQELIAAYKKINGNMFSSLNLSKIVNKSLKAINLKKLAEYDKCIVRNFHYRLLR